MSDAPVSVFFIIAEVFEEGRRRIMEKKTMTVGVIGSGAISDVYLKNMIERFDVLKVKSIASLHIENARKKAAAYGITACTVDELLSDPEIDIVVNLTPVGAHYEIIKKALLSGKHVYTEKTMTDTVESAEELVNLANEKGLYLGSAPDTFFGAALQAAREAIDDGLIGKVHSFAMSANRNNDILLSVFSFLREKGAGIVNDYGVYYVTALISLLGSVKKVGGICFAPYKTHVNILPTSRDFGKVMDTPNESRASAVVVMESGVSGTIHLDADSIMKDQAFFAIYGSKGILYIDDPNMFDGKVKLVQSPLDPRQPCKETVLWKFSPYKDNSRGVGVADMAEAIITGKKERADKEMALHAEEVLAAILAGGEDGAFVDVKSRFARPERLERKKVGITNIGHTSFNAKNMDEMLKFYCEVLGMQKLFTLTMGDLAASILERMGGKVPPERAQMTENFMKMKDVPWITYLKMSDRQYIELFHDMPTKSGNPKKEIADRSDYLGYRKVNFEVDDIEALSKRLKEHGTEILEDVHQTLEGAKELHVKDPDGNDVMFMEYGKTAPAFVPEKDKTERSFNAIAKYTTQVAYNIRDEINMPAFYTKGLGLKKVNEFTFADLAAALEKSGAPKEQIAGLKMLGDRPWIEYIEVAPHQYIELFHSFGKELKESGDLTECYGYQHLCLEVSDIHKAWDAVLANGLKPSTEITLGADNSYQFWLVDPDGNRLELMEYPASAKQLG